ncbi:DUF2310 family Zn-ribbon-containing protein [Chitinophaga sp. CF118]
MSTQCPCCGKEWKLEKKLFDEFDLKCDEMQNNIKYG